MLRDIEAVALDGRRVQVSDFRGRRNLVLVFEGESTAPPIAALRQAGDELREEETVVLVVPSTDARSRGLYGVHGAALFISDRYGEIFFATDGGQPLPSVSDILDWLRFINSQCPE